MPKLRRSRAYRRIERPYTRISKFKKKSFVNMSPPRKITRFNMGTQQEDYKCTLDLIPKSHHSGEAGSHRKRKADQPKMA